MTDGDVTLKFLTRIDDCFVGTDGDEYGPFKEKDVATIPKPNADVFIKRGLAELVPVPPVESQVAELAKSKKINLRAFEDYKSKYPDFFPAGTPLEIQMDGFKPIQTRRITEEKEKRDRLQNLDAATVTAMADRELRDGATTTLKTSNPFGVFRRGFSLNHCGDDEILRAVIYATVLQSSRTTKGLQIFITGDSGSGKSSAVKSAVHLLPPEKVVEGSFSDKAFFLKLAGRVKPVVYLDDIFLSDSQVSTVKRAMTNFQKTTDHNTITERRLDIQTIPARTLWLGNAVNETGDDQLKNRYLSLGIQNTPENDLEYSKWELQRRKEGRPDGAVNDDVTLSRAILQHIAEREFVVIGLDNIQFGYLTDRRLINILLDLMEANTILFYLQRNHSEENGVITVHPVPDDLNAALNFTMFNLTDKSSQGRLTKAERALDDALQAQIGDHIERQFTESEIVELVQRTLTRVRALLYGRDGSPQKVTGGLLEKAPWYSLDTDPESRKHIIRVKRHIHQAFDQFARVTP